jgi:hypothetical protein
MHHQKKQTIHNCKLQLQIYVQEILFKETTPLLLQENIINRFQWKSQYQRFEIDTCTET